MQELIRTSRGNMARKCHSQSCTGMRTAPTGRPGIGGTRVGRRSHSGAGGSSGGKPGEAYGGLAVAAAVPAQVVAAVPAQVVAVV